MSVTLVKVHPDNCGGPMRHPDLADRAKPCGCGCLVFWGSHGCDLDYGHDEPIHVCMPDGDDFCTRLRITGPWGPGEYPGWASAAGERQYEPGGEWFASDPAAAFTWDNRIAGKVAP